MTVVVIAIGVVLSISSLAEKVAQEDRVMQGLADQLQAPIRVTRCSGIQCKVLFDYRYIEVVELPRLRSEQINAVTVALNELTDGSVILVQHTQLREDDLQRLKDALSEGKMLSDGPIRSSQPVTWEAFEPAHAKP